MQIGGVTGHTTLSLNSNERSKQAFQVASQEKQLKPAGIKKTQSANLQTRLNKRRYTSKPSSTRNGETESRLRTLECAIHNIDDV